MTGPVAPAVVWRWPAAVLGLAAALPAAAVVLSGDPAQGLALAAGVLPGAAIGVSGPRRARIMIVVLGAVVAVGILLGSALAMWPVAAVAGIVALAIGASLVAARIRFGRVLLALALPMVGVGFSYPGVAAGAPLAGIMFLGSVYVWLVSLAWPQRPAAQTPPPVPVDSGSLDYGIRLGLAAGIAAGIGFALGAQHVGWACAACLLVMRPLPDMVRLRGLDRLLDIIVGSLAASLIVLYTPEPAVLAGTVLVTVTAMAATRASRRYLTPAFTTTIVFLLLLYGSPQDAQHRFNERLAETALGVALALLFSSHGHGNNWPAGKPRATRERPIRKRLTLGACCRERAGHQGQARERVGYAFGMSRWKASGSPLRIPPAAHGRGGIGHPGRLRRSDEHPAFSVGDRGREGVACGDVVAGTHRVPATPAGG